MLDTGWKYPADKVFRSCVAGLLNVTRQRISSNLERETHKQHTKSLHEQLNSISKVRAKHSDRFERIAPLLNERLHVPLRTMRSIFSDFDKTVTNIRTNLNSIEAIPEEKRNGQVPRLLELLVTNMESITDDLRNLHFELSHSPYKSEPPPQGSDLDDHMDTDELG